MRIDGTYRPQAPGTNPLSDALDAAKTLPQASASQGNPDDGLSVAANSLASYVEKVRLTPEINAQAVAEARRLMEAGELDTPEAIQRAAQAMVDGGI
jgi:hypothetical protein